MTLNFRKENKKMDEISQRIINDLGIQLANKTIEASEYNARLISVQSELDEYNSLIANNEDLKTLFEEVKGKMVNGNQ
jgi:hypothetical protein